MNMGQEQHKDGQDETQQPESGATGQQENSKKGGIHNNALYAASMGRAASENVHRHDNSALGTTGTNVTYEGPIAAGGGASVGTGYASGQNATGITSTQSEDYDQAGMVEGRKEKDTEDEEDTEKS